MSKMQAFYTQLSAAPRESYFAALLQLTRAKLAQVKALTLGWWYW